MTVGGRIIEFSLNGKGKKWKGLINVMVHRVMGRLNGYCCDCKGNEWGVIVMGDK